MTESCLWSTETLKAPSVLLLLLHSLSHSNVSSAAFKRARWAGALCAETAVMQHNFVQEMPTERLRNPSLSVAAASGLTESKGSADGVIRSIWRGRHRCAVYKLLKQSSVAKPHPPCLFLYQLVKEQEDEGKGSQNIQMRINEWKRGRQVRSGLKWTSKRELKRQETVWTWWQAHLQEVTGSQKQWEFVTEWEMKRNERMWKENDKWAA